jgi:hypothetical protein
MPGESGRITTRGSDRRRGRVKRAELRADVVSLEKRIDDAEAEKLELEQDLSEAFESKNVRYGKKLNRELTRTTTLLEDLYAQWAAKA